MKKIQPYYEHRLMLVENREGQGTALVLLLHRQSPQSAPLH